MGPKNSQRAVRVEMPERLDRDVGVEAEDGAAGAAVTHAQICPQDEGTSCLLQRA